jgi:arylsulfatase A-like enzyme
MNRKRLSVIAASSMTIVFTLALFGALSVASGGSASATATREDATASPTAEVSETPLPQTGQISDIKNVVLLLADDLDWATFNEVPRLKNLMAEGTTLSNFVVTSSLCCPSRTSILRSQFVHNHKVLSNVPETGGGWAKFNAQRLQRDCLPNWLQSKGISTSLVGKYLNGFPKGAPSPTYIPPGFNNFITSVSLNQSYKGYNYVLNENGTLRKYGNAPTDFINDVLTAKATNIIATATTPFFLEFASYSPHTPAPVAARNVGSHAGSFIPRTPSYNSHGIDEPAWLRKIPSLSPNQLANLDRMWTRRLESSESLADSYDALVAQLKASGHSQDTLIIVTSDNGYHLASHRLPSGKQTPYREDSVVPAVLIGPGIEPGRVISEMTSTLDLAPTIAQIQGVQPPGWIDGRSLLPLLNKSTDVAWRTGALTESLARARRGDPDFGLGAAPTFRALRTQSWLYVEYSDRSVQLIDLVNDPFEVNNVIRSTSPTIVQQLQAQLRALSVCAGPSCLIADSMPTPEATGELIPVETPIPDPSASTTLSPSASASVLPTPAASPVG